MGDLGLHDNWNIDDEAMVAFFALPGDYKFIVIYRSWSLFRL